jgi:hypothetical protein
VNLIHARAHRPAPLSFIHHRVPTVPSRRRSSPPTLRGGPLVRARRRTSPTPVLRGGHRSPPSAHPHSEEDAGRNHRHARAQRRTALATTGTSTWSPPACPLPPPAEMLITIARSPHMLSRQVIAPFTSPLANLLLLEKNCDSVRLFREVKKNSLYKIIVNYSLKLIDTN